MDQGQDRIRAGLYRIGPKRFRPDRDQRSGVNSFSSTVGTKLMDLINFGQNYALLILFANSKEH